MYRRKLLLPKEALRCVNLSQIDVDLAALAPWHHQNNGETQTMRVTLGGIHINQLNLWCCEAGPSGPKGLLAPAAAVLSTTISGFRHNAFEHDEPIGFAASYPRILYADDAQYRYI